MTEQMMYTLPQLVILSECPAVTHGISRMHRISST